MAESPFPGPSQMRLAPATDMGQESSLAQVSKVLGLPQQSFPISADQHRSAETYTLQMLSRGKQEYTGFTITSAMESSNAQIFRVFPLKKATAVTFVKQTMDFIKEIAPETTAGTAPGYVELEESEYQATLSRYAMGATTTVQELKTTKGQFIWRGKLIVVAIAFIETAELLAIQTLLTTPSFYAKYQIKSGQHQFDLARAGRLKDSYWDILRTERGFATLHESVKKEFGSQNLRPTHVIVAEGTRSVVMADPTKLEFYRNGEGASENSTKLGDMIGDTLDGLTLIVVRPIDLRKKDIRIMPLERLAVIGQHFRVDHFYKDCTLADWCSSYMTIAVYSLESNQFEQLDLEKCIMFCHRFNKSDGRLSGHHQTLANNASQLDKRGFKILVENKVPQYDMFLYTEMNNSGETATRVATLWGMMEEFALRQTAIDRTAGTLQVLIDRMLLSTGVAALKRGKEDMDELFDTELTEEDRLAMQAAMRPGVARTRYNVPLPQYTAGTGIRPGGYGGVMQYLALSKIVSNPGGRYDATLIKNAQEFSKAAKALYEVALEIFGITHPALDPNNVPAAYRIEGDTAEDRKMNSMTNFLVNIFDGNKANLFVQRKIIVRADDNTETTEQLAGAGDFDEISADDYPGLETSFRGAGGISPHLATAFGSQASLKKFETAFVKSQFGQNFSAYIEARRAATGRTARRRRGGAQDADAAETVEIPEGPANLQMFHSVLLQLATANSLQSDLAFMAAYSRLIDAVRATTAPPVNDDLLIAWLGDTDAYTATRALGGADSAEFVVTPFVGSSLAIKGQNAYVRTGSVFNSSLSVNPDNAQQLENEGNNDVANGDLMKTTIYSKARPAGRRSGGLFHNYSDVSTKSPLYGTRMPSFGSANFQDVVGAELVSNRNIIDRFLEASGTASLTLRIAKLLFLVAPITAHVLWAFKMHNIASPVAYLIEQPFRRYLASTTIFLSKPDGSSIGNIQYFDPDTHIGRNSISKSISLHTSMYLGATYENVNDWLNAYDTLVCGIGGGESTTPYTLQKWQQVSNPNKQDLDSASLFIFMVPSDSLIGNAEDRVPMTHDIRGYSDTMHYTANSIHKKSKFANRPYFSSAPYYTTLFNFDRLLRPVLKEHWSSFDVYADQGVHNTVTKQGLQLLWNPVSKKFDQCIMATDEFKGNVYPQCRELRESNTPKHYKNMNWEKMAVPL